MTDAAPVGILGGTFDPIHFGHLRLGLEVAERCGLAQVRFIPAGRPPHRDAPATPAADRLAMARLAAAGNPLFAVDEREVERAGPCYTVDTLDSLRAELGPARPICLITGADAFLGLPKWSRWTRIFDLAHVIVAGRPGYGITTAALDAGLSAEYGRRLAADAAELAQAPAGRILEAEIPLLDISATDIRARRAAGRSARYLLPDAVLDYIDAHGLYGVE